jgi:hypothetical protein
MATLQYSIPENPNPVYNFGSNDTLDIDVYFPHLGEVVRFTAAKSDPGWEHSEELYARALAGEFGPIAPAPEPPPSAPDYLAFWDALMVSTVYGSIREQSFVSLPMNTLATEFIALIGDAKAGRANEAAIQGSMSAILGTGTFTEAHISELGAALAAGNLDGIYTLT